MADGNAGDPPGVSRESRPGRRGTRAHRLILDAPFNYSRPPGVSNMGLDSVVGRQLHGPQLGLHAAPAGTPVHGPNIPNTGPRKIRQGGPVTRRFFNDT